MLQAVKTKRLRRQEPGGWTMPRVGGLDVNPKKSGRLTEYHVCSGF
jgi:hypothetical protein